MLQTLYSMFIYTLPDYQDFDHKIGDQKTHLFILKNRTGMQVAFTDYGARIVSILVPDKTGCLRDVVLGFNTIQNYIQAEEQYHGAIVGRYANRIAEGHFRLDGADYQLQQNNGPNNLHGGPTGFHSKVWDRQTSFKKKIDFSYISPDGEEGFPGTLKVHVSYELTEENELIIKYNAETDKKTIINLTNHAYFNLDGEGQGDVLNHVIQIPAEHFLPIDENQIPLGEESAVERTVFDFRQPKKLADDLDKDEEQLKRANGYDHTFVNRQPISQAAASAYSPNSGIGLQVFTTEPGVHFYTGNFLSVKDTGKSGRTYPPRSAFCFETQHYPDSPNQAHFPAVVLEPGQVFESETIYKFSIKKVSPKPSLLSQSQTQL